MSTLSPQLETRLRLAFRQLNRGMLLLWRLGLGRLINIWPTVGGRIMVIQHIGRKTGLVRHTPVNYAQVDGEIYCTAGFGAMSHWYRNLQDNPEVEIWLPNGRFHALAQDITDQPNTLPILRQVLINSGFAAPAFNLYPKTMPDAELSAATAHYRLIRFNRQKPAAGQADLVWVWPMAALLLWIWFRKGAALVKRLGRLDCCQTTADHRFPDFI